MLIDQSIIVLADWLKVRGTLKGWTKLWCILKPGLLLLYRSPKAKVSYTAQILEQNRGFEPCVPELLDLKIRLNSNCTVLCLVYLQVLIPLRFQNWIQKKTNFVYPTLSLSLTGWDTKKNNQVFAQLIQYLNIVPFDLFQIKNVLMGVWINEK